MFEEEPASPQPLAKLEKVNIKVKVTMETELIQKVIKISECHED
jgi:hypothetical protein